MSSIKTTVRWRSNHRQMALQSVPTSNLLEPLQGPGQTKASGDHQRETTHEISCLAAKCKVYKAGQDIIKFNFQIRFSILVQCVKIAILVA